MDPFPNLPPVGPGHPLPSAPTIPANQASQFIFQPTNEQIVWLQQQQQRLHEHQAAILQIFYAQQARGFSPDTGIHGANMNMLSNPFPAAPIPYAYGFPPFLNGQSMASTSLNNLSFQYPMAPTLHQPPPLFPPFSLPAMGLSSDNEKSLTTGNQPFPSTSASDSTPGADCQKSISVSTPMQSSMTGEFTEVDDLILAKALRDHGTSREAMSSLAGMRDHSVSAWQTYYASKQDIIDKNVQDLYLSDNITTAKKKHSRRHAHLGIPTKEPTPSKKLVPQGAGYKYTEEDDEYFTQYVLWSFSQDSESPKPTICQALSLKVPHHSLHSWKAYWRLRDMDIERVRQLFKDGTPPNGVTSFAVTDNRRRRGRATRLVPPQIQGIRSCDLGSQSNKSTAMTVISVYGSDSSASDSNGGSSEDDQTGANAKIRSTNQNYIPYSKADLQAVVNFMAESPTLSCRTRWDALSKQRPAHSSKGWGEYYRRNKAMIDRKVRCLLKRRAKEDTGSKHVMLKDTHTNESRLKNKPVVSRYTTRSRSGELVRQSQLSSASQNKKQLDASYPLLQLSSPTNIIDLPHPPTKPATISESSCESQPAVSNPIAVPHDPAQSAPAVSGMDKCQSRGWQSSRDPFHLLHVKPSQLQPGDRHTVKHKPSTSLSAAQWPSESRESEIGIEGHAPVRLPRDVSPLTPCSPSYSSPATPPPTQLAARKRSARCHGAKDTQSRRH